MGGAHWQKRWHHLSGLKCSWKHSFPSVNLTTLVQIFEKKGLDLMDLVALSGAHTLGVAQCSVFSKRLYNFTGRGGTDPLLNKTYAEVLKGKCPVAAKPETTVEIDPHSSGAFDSNYYRVLLLNQGLLSSDAALLTSNRLAMVVQRLLESSAFFSQFAQSMLRMGSIEVLTGEAGEVRKNCRVNG